MMTVEVDGEKYTVKELSDKTRLSIDTIRGRLRRGEKGERLLRPQEKPKRIIYYGKAYERMGDLMKDKGLTKNQVRYRLRRGAAEYLEETNE